VLQIEHSIDFRPLASRTSSHSHNLQIPQGVLSSACSFCFLDFLLLGGFGSFMVLTVLFFLSSLEAGTCCFLFRGSGCLFFSSRALLYGELVRTSALCDFFRRCSALCGVRTYIKDMNSMFSGLDQMLA